MAEIKPLRAWRYAPTLPYPIHSLVSPLFDVVSEGERKTLYETPHNSIHLSFPPDSNASAEIGRLLERWKNNGIIEQDELPGIYVYYQYFKLPGKEEIRCQKGFLAHIRVCDWEEKVVLGHENTMPEAVSFQAGLLAKTEFHVSPTHGLYTDPDLLLEKWMDEAISSPICTVEGEQGTKNVLAVIHDYKVISEFVRVLQEKKIILADGHHRYQASIDWAKKQKATNPCHTGEEGYNFHLVYLSNTVSNGLHIFPTHRLIKNLNVPGKTTVLNELSRFFYLNSVKDVRTLNRAIPDKPYAFGILLKGESYTLQLRPEWYGKVAWDMPNTIKQLDVTVAHYFIFEKVLKIPHEKQCLFEKIKFEHSFSKCLEMVNDGKIDLALIMREVSIETIKKVSEGGYTMPQKSTYFYPKLICGLLFSSIKGDEFQAFPHLSLQ